MPVRAVGEHVWITIGDYKAGQPRAHAAVAVCGAKWRHTNSGRGRLRRRALGLLLRDTRRRLEKSKARP